MTERRFSDFNYDDAGYERPEHENADDILARREELWVPTGFDSKAGEQMLLVTRTVPDTDDWDPEKTAIARGTAFTDEATRVENGIFDAYIAAATGREVYSVIAPSVLAKDQRGTPTYDIETGEPIEDLDFGELFKLTPEQKEALAKGRFIKAGGAAMKAMALAQDELNPNNNGNFIVSASSQGAAMMAGGISHAVEHRYIDVEAAVLAEVVNNKARNPAVLLGQFVAANTDAGGYLEQNPKLLNETNEGTMGWGKRAAQSFGANVRYGKALSRGGFNADLSDETLGSLGEQGAPFIVTRGSESKLADEGAHEELLERLRARNIMLLPITYRTATHGFTMTVRSIADPVNQLDELRHMS